VPLRGARRGIFVTRRRRSAPREAATRDDLPLANRRRRNVRRVVPERPVRPGSAPTDPVAAAIAVSESTSKMLQFLPKRLPAAIVHGLLAAACLGAFLVALPEAGAAQPFAVERGPSGLPLPRFVSLKADRVNVRAGPGRSHRIKWTFTKSGTPVEIVREFDNWRRIRFADGTDGWVYHAMLSSERTAIVRPWQQDDLVQARSSPTDGARVTAKLEPMVLARVKSCADRWCEIAGNGWAGFVQKEELWGVYPNEVID
jgi:SH3-like domain-containing protein